VTFGNLPAKRVWAVKERLNGNIGYFGFNLFLDPANVMAAFNSAMSEFLHDECRGVILDLRGNGGGIGPMAMGMAGWFVAERGQRLGTMRTRDNEIRFAVNPRAATYGGPLAILVDGLSASTAEILAGGLKDLGRARLFGTPTAGAALPSYIERLPNGDGFQFAIADYVSEGGDILEGTGVMPHVLVTPTRSALLAGRDPILDSAVDWILQSN
jgi:carboxyl-terminal processing protease